MMRRNDNTRPGRARRRGLVLKARGEQGGFTLVETSVALLVMMVAGLSIASVFAFAVSYNKGANGRAVAQAIAQRQMEFLRKSAYNEIVDSTQVVTRAGLSYSVVTQVCDNGSVACGGSTSVKRVTVTATPLNSGTGWASGPVILVTLRGKTSLGSFYH